MDNPEEKIKVLCLMDTPTCATGFAMVARNVLKQLHNTGKYDITILGINHYGEWYDQTKFPYKIYPAMPHGYSDPYGRGMLFQTLQGKNKAIKPPFDLLFTIQDHFILEGSDPQAQGFNLSARIKELQYAILTNPKVSMDNFFNWIGYWPVDGNLRPSWVQKGIALCDYPVAYTQYGAREILKHDTELLKTKARLEVIPHGVNTKDFHPISDEEIKTFRKEYFAGHVKEDTFLITNISRNQPRKDIARTIKIFAEYKKINPKAFLYLHMQANDAGGDLFEMAYQFGLQEGKDMACPDPSFTAMHGFPIEELNKMYNASDCLLTTTLGEGWGFINTEAMAVKRPILAPANTSIPEIFGIAEGDNLKDMDNTLRWRGIPLLCGNNLDNWTCLGSYDNSVIRPVTDVQDAIDKLDWVYKNKDKVKEMTDRAYEWVQTLTWDSVCNQWSKVFDMAYDELKKTRAKGHITSSNAVFVDEKGNEINEKGEPLKKIRPNDTCPFCYKNGISIKYKKCIHGGRK